MLVAIGVANEGRDGPDALYTDSLAPDRGLDGCEKGHGTITRSRRAVVAFACSLSRPIEWRAAMLGQVRMKRLIDGFGFNLPPAASDAEATPPSTAAARGLIAGSPRRVHHMAGVILAALTGQGGRPVGAPSLVKSYEFVARGAAEAGPPEQSIVPNRLVRPHGHAFLRTVLQAPLCYRHQGAAHGTLKSLGTWCAGERAGLRLHFAKTGTDTNEDPGQTIDTWIAGGLQFANGAAYSYVVVVGTGSTREPFAKNLHAAQVAAPLLEVLLADLEARSRQEAVFATRPSAPPTVRIPKAAAKPVAAGRRLDDPARRQQIFNSN
jgi:hypothetical protein